MGRSLCQLVVVICCALHGVTSMAPASAHQEGPASCNGPLVRFPGKKLLVASQAGTVSLTVDTDGSASYSCSLREESESTKNGQAGQTVRCSQNEFRDVLAQCYEAFAARQGQRSRRHIEKRTVIYPGTVWCGAGNNSGGDTTKLGKYSQTDACCRTHDFCTPQIQGLAYDISTNLRNWSPFTRLHCRCDNEFRACLKSSTDGLGKFMGNVYFNVVASTCYDLVSRCPNNGTSPDCMKWQWISSGSF